jgi:hypothetical protein
LTRDNVYNNQNEKAAHYERSAGLFQPNAGGVKHRGDKQDIHDIRYPDVEKWIEHRPSQAGMGPAKRSCLKEPESLQKHLTISPTSLVGETLQFQLPGYQNSGDCKDHYNSRATGMPVAREELAWSLLEFCPRSVE